jgi:hypothetical protein
MPAPISRLPADVTALLGVRHGFFMLREAVAAGITTDRVHRLVRSGLLAAVARGAYAATAQLEKNRWEAHAICTSAFLTSCQENSFAAGWSAVALRRLPVLGKPPSVPHVLRLGSAGQGVTRSRYGRVVVAHLPEKHQAIHAGHPIVGKAWMVADIARTADHAHALVLADAALRDGLTRSALLGAVEDLRGWPGVRNAAWVAEHADCRSETALESLGRLSCIEGTLPVPLSNVWVGPGYPLYRVDHLWPYHWVVAEGDGALKYRGRDPAAVVKAEKEREWALRRLGLEVVRYDWELAAYRRADLVARFRHLLDVNPVRARAVQWWPVQNAFVGQDGEVVC